MILQFLFIIYSIFLFSINKISTKTSSFRLVYILLWITLILFIGFRDGTKVYDYEVYEKMYYASELLVEPTFLFIKYICNELLSLDIIALMLIYSFIGITIKFIALYRFSTNIFMSMLIWLGNLFLIQDFTQIRGAVSIGIFLLSLDALYNHQKKFFIYFIVAFLFHTSSLLMLPLWFLSNNKINVKFWIIITLIVYILALLKIDLISIIGMIPIERVQERFMVYKAARENPANIFSILQLGKIALWGILLWKAKLLQQKNKYAILFIKILGISIITLPIFAIDDAIATRVKEFYSSIEILLFPMLMYIIKPEYTAKLIVFFYAFISIYWRLVVQQLIKS